MPSAKLRRCTPLLWARRLPLNMVDVANGPRPRIETVHVVARGPGGCRGKSLGPVKVADPLVLPFTLESEPADAHPRP